MSCEENVCANFQESMPVELKKFNWGAFLLSWVWGVGNKSYIALWGLTFPLISCVPYIGWAISLALGIWFGVKGNEWAWQNDNWESVEHFNKIQKRWVIAGIVVHFGLLILLTILLFFLIVLVGISDGISS